MSIQLKPIIAALGLGLATLSGSAAAVTLFSPITGFQDNNVDFVIQGVDGDDALLDVGDTLISVFEIDNTFGVLSGGTAPIGNNQELTGVAAITLLSTTATLDTLGANNDFIFGTANFDGLFGTSFGAGAIAAMWLGTAGGALDLETQGPTNCASLADCIAKATDGSLFEVDGFAGDGDEFWVALNANGDLGTVLTSPVSSQFGAVNFGLSILDDGPNTYTDQACGGGIAGLCAANLTGVGVTDGRIDVIGSGNVLGGQGLGAALIADGAVAHSDFDFQKAVPEPATLALLGVGLLGMGASLRRRVR